MKQIGLHVLQMAVVGAMVVLMAGCKKKVQSEGAGTKEVEVARVERGEGVARKEYAFITEPRRRSLLSFRVGGYVEEFDAYVGTYFKKGDVIGVIDDRDYVLRVEQTEATYRRAKAEYERMETLYKKDNVAATTYEHARQEYYVAKTAYDKAVNDLADTRLTAPMDGYVSEVYIDRYEDVRAAQRVVELVDISELRVEVYVTADVAAAMDTVEWMDVVMDGERGATQRVRIVESARSASANNLSYKVTGMLENGDGRWSAGVSGKAYVDVASNGERVVTVPQRAVCNQPQRGDYVWVADSDGVVMRRGVEIGRLLPGGKIEVLSGLSEGETVVTSGMRFLNEKEKVNI